LHLVVADAKEVLDIRVAVMVIVVAGVDTVDVGTGSGTDASGGVVACTLVDTQSVVADGTGLGGNEPVGIDDVDGFHGD
jgi:hypothetical protein